MIINDLGQTYRVSYYGGCVLKMAIIPWDCSSEESVGKIIRRIGEAICRTKIL